LAPPVRNYSAPTNIALIMTGVIKNRYVRPPLTAVSSEEKVEIKRYLRVLGYL